MNAIKLLKEQLNYNSAVIKNIHEHKIDTEGKDSYKFSEQGAIFSITKNIYNETTIFSKQELSVEEIVEWLDKSSNKIEVVFTEGFRDLKCPTILCVTEIDEIEKEITEFTKMVSGLVLRKKHYEFRDLKIPILDINKDFQKFLDLFEIK